MGIFSFSKKKEEQLGSKSIENLDLPPLPGIEPATKPTPQEEEDFFSSIPEAEKEADKRPLPPNAEPFEFQKIEPIAKLTEFDIPEVPFTEIKEQPEEKAEEEIPDTLPPLEDEEFEELPSPQKAAAAEKIRKPIIAERNLGINISRPKPVAPLFVHTDDYQQMLENISTIRNKLKDSDNVFSRINELKNTQDSSFERLRNTLEDVERKLIFIDKSLFETE